MPEPLTLGTAGHVDHGKTALVKALTGTDTDRLPEERERELSIELGYALLELPSGRSVSLVDVPGHQRFVRTMVAGATGVDLFLMVVAADDGVMPQTREHARVLRALGVSRGVLAITKCDAADPARALEEAAELLPGVEGVAVSAQLGQGLDELRLALDRVAASVPARPAAHAEAPARLHVDRSFTITGAGTVVTGTLWSGRIARGDHVDVLPAGLGCRVRRVHVHDHEVESAAAGQRVALNLVGVSRDDVNRGDVVSSARDLKARRTIDVELDLEEPIDRGERVQVHHGTRESPARVSRKEGRPARLRLEGPLLAAPGDRLVLRRIAPPETLGGGVVVQRDAVEAPAAQAPPPAPPEPLSSAALELEQRLLAAGSQPPLDSELNALEGELAQLRAAGRAVRVGPRLHFHPRALEEVREMLEARLADGTSISIAQLRDALGTSRKFAQALLEHFDGEGLTLRRGDAHVLRRRRRERAGAP